MNAPAIDITLIAALDPGGVIGAGGAMPWHIPGDLRWFKRHTRHKPVLMGRRTYDSIGRALPQRRNLVMSRQPALAADGVERVADWPSALAAARAAGAGELMVIGGAEIFRLALPYATRMLLTRIEQRYAGDTWFPAIDWRDWQLVDETVVAARAGTPAHRFTVWRRGARTR